MGSSTTSDVVKNVALVGNIQEFEDAFLDSDGEGPVVVRHWVVDRAAVTSGKRGRLFADLLVKDKHRVFLLNTSPYAAGGDFDFAVYADSKNDVKAFLKDFNIDVRIEDEDSVCQTL